MANKQEETYQNNSENISDGINISSRSLGVFAGWELTGYPQPAFFSDSKTLQNSLSHGSLDDFEITFSASEKFALDQF